MKIKLLVGIIFALALTLLVERSDVFSKQNSEVNKFSLPATAVKVKDNVYYLGKARDVDGREVEGYAFIRGKSADARPSKPPKGGGPSCYGYLASGAKWKTVESWVVNPNMSGLQGSFVGDNILYDISKWESVAGTNILGDENTTGENLVADTSSPDGQNEVYFAGISDSNTIAVTIVWGYFGGRPQNRELVEWDQVYNNVDYAWSSSGEAGKMDFENIATHELGHAVGMDDLYDTSCQDVTMYGYADYGETNKRSLETPDITGVFKLYN